MNRDDILRMAWKAGADQFEYTDGTASQLPRIAAAAFAAGVKAGAEAEREACAKVCDDWPVGRDDVYSIGQAIRARGEK